MKNLLEYIIGISGVAMIIMLFVAIVEPSVYNVKVLLVCALITLISSKSYDQIKNV